MTFADLGNAIRKCSADFSIDIELDLAPIRCNPESHRSLWHCAVGAIHYEAGDSFLLCTDGLTEGLYEHHLVDHLGPKGPSANDVNPAHQLVEQALANDGRDNTTALVVQIR